MSVTAQPSPSYTLRGLSGPAQVSIGRRAPPTVAQLTALPTSVHKCPRLAYSSSPAHLQRDILQQSCLLLACDKLVPAREHLAATHTRGSSAGDKMVAQAAYTLGLAQKVK